MRQALFLIGLGCVAIVGCRAEVRTNADFSVSGRANVEEKASEPESSEAFAEPPADTPIQAKQAAVATPTRAPFIGVTPDLTLAPAQGRSPACQCLALAHGQPGSSAFEWQGGPPQATDDSIAVAISGDGVPCNWQGEVPTPSIAGVERSDNDVVITVEPAREGRPIMRGAMILRPGPRGSLIIKGKGNVPFGRPADGSAGTCRIPVPN